ncbi:hypothetical protein L842_1266 [Mycobacterium intracellulare MIN_052511_1280]|nr:hypothetical protein L842_1266 [Mycobacterium intracellulare MIN_052511_1280]
MPPWQQSMTLTIGNDATPVAACPLCRRADMTSRDDAPKGSARRGPRLSRR